MYKACLSKGGFEEEPAGATFQRQVKGSESAKDERLVLDPVDIKDMEDEEKGDEDEPDKTVKHTIKHFKERAEQYAKTHFDEHVKKQKKK